MEHTLRAVAGIMKDTARTVLILVVMEHTLREYNL